MLIFDMRRINIEKIIISSDFEKINNIRWLDCREKHQKQKCDRKILGFRDFFEKDYTL